MLKLEIVTIVLDGYPWITKHLTQFEKLSSFGIEWHWSVMEGAAMNYGSTKWCRPQPPRLSQDRTNIYLKKLVSHPFVNVASVPQWGSKDAMVNFPLSGIVEPCVLMQIDSDELWKADQLAKIVELFTSNQHYQRAYFWCRYFVGPDIITTSQDGYGNRNGKEWLRAWRFFPGMRFASHEPPVLSGNKGMAISRDETRSMGLTFDHMAYATEAQVAFKERFYGYKDALAHWKRLQNNHHWPAPLGKFLPWVESGVWADKIPVDMIPVW